MINKIKETRQVLDGLSNGVRELKSSAHVTLSMRNLQLAKMWLGKCLKELAVANPYPESRNPENNIIEPTQDTGLYHFKTERDNPIGRVKEMRAAIESACNTQKEILDAEDADKKNVDDLPDEFFYMYLRESILESEKAGMWLGMELSDMRTTDALPQPGE